MIKPKMSDEEKRKILEELLRPVPKSSGGRTGSIDFNSLEWELQSPRQLGKTEKQLMYFDNSQQRVLSAGYERHPFSAEAFALICTYLDDEKDKTKLLSEQQTETAKDMLTGYGEFFCQAIKTEQNDADKIVRFYELVTALPRNNANTGYEETGLIHSGQTKEFDVSDLSLGNFHYFKNIHKKHDDLIIYTHSRKFEDLPEKIKEIGGIYLPNPNNVWPAGRGDGGGRFFIGSCYLSRASRGVR